MFVKRFQPFYVPDGQPQAGGDPAPLPQAGNTPSPDPQAGSDPKTRTSEEYEKEITALRRENAGHRTKLTAFEKAEEERKAAALSELEKAQKKASEVETQLATQTKALQEMRVTLAIERNAAKLNIVDPEAAVKLIDLSAIEYDDNGHPKNIEKLLDDLVKAKPYLVSQPGQPKANNSGGASNPPRSQSGATGLTREIIERMRPEEYAARREEIYAWLRQQK